MLTWIFLALFWRCSRAFEAHFDDKKCDTYHVEHNGRVLFRGQAGMGVFVEGAWQTTKHGNLKLQASTNVEGKLGSLGSYTGVKAQWHAGKNTQYTTTLMNFEDSRVIGFQVSFPVGASDTSLVNSTDKDSYSRTITNFPAFTDYTLKDTLSWQGSFMPAQNGRQSQGPAGGPTVFFDAAHVSTAMAVVGSPLDSFKEWSAGAGSAWTGAAAFAPGLAGTLKNLPANFSHTFILHLAGSPGVTQAIHEYGQLIQAYYKTYKIKDITLTKIGYQTDNGAYYVFCRGNCSRTLIEEVEYLRRIGVPPGYLSFQGGGASSYQSGGGAPWCINTWGVDGGLGGNFPLDLKTFQKALGVPLQLYAPYFCPKSEYFNSTSRWTPVKSDTSLPGCSYYDFQDVEPKQSRSFYDWFFSHGVEVGMASFEPDFMNQNYHCVPDFTEKVGTSTMWQHGMADAALALGVAVQWCYATPTDVLNALHMPSVTNFRVSTDFCYGNSWNVGESSLLPWALHAYPSKDTLWTTTNNHFAVPGCRWTPDHEHPAVELHVVLAVLTTGPVGISDSINNTNAELMKRGITKDGTLLSPSKPATTVDSFIASKNQGGHVYGTYSGSSPTDVWAHYLVSFKLKAEVKLPLTDLWPPVGSSRIFHRSFHHSRCVNGSKLTAACGNMTAMSTEALTLPKSDFSNVTGGTDFAPHILVTTPVCANSYVLLGEVSKYVSVSTKRFANVKCDAGISFAVSGSVGETVSITFLRPVSQSVWEIGVLTAHVPASGTVHMHVR